MLQGDDPIAVLSEAECWSLLGEHSLGRLAVSAAKEIDIFPVNYYADGSTILLRTAPGTKLLEMTIRNDVAFEIDDFTDTDALSVVIKGTARELESQADIDVADQLPLTPWIPTLKYVYVEISPNSISGRRFDRGPEPERY
jgi:nitroimidazol reductase NimA-like FMN-containing flavoprotein (pyridoxamine 5'-phosphate oxidase superfamily)